MELTFFKQWLYRMDFAGRSTFTEKEMNQAYDAGKKLGMKIMIHHVDIHHGIKLSLPEIE